MYLQNVYSLMLRIFCHFASLPTRVNHHDELVALGAMSNGQVDLTQGELARGRATVSTSDIQSGSQTTAKAFI